ncbi:glycosyltransferase [Polaromonas sp.]|uniref:glycosyltransferase n=1 Tax=Polaromonas sp. TaxID=1869339 RepID=UPI002730EF1D|nr:glycosyltransferase [Polaromonas sp.]MDP1741486.1 glycosyltransferase [Polaromonas sp.]
MDPIAPEPAAPPIHLVGRFDDRFAGAERELLALRDALQGCCALQLWSVVPPHAWYAGQGVQAVQPFGGRFPRTGVLVWGGAHVAPAVWLKYTRFARVMLHCNLASWERFFALIEILRDSTALDPELVFVSQALRLTAGLPGHVVYSPMDIEPLLQAAGARRPAAGAPLTVGRISRDAPDKHHPQDPDLYRMLTAAGWRVRIMGGTCLAPQLAGVAGVELLAAGAEEVADFYQSLDVFFYRTGSTVEAYGRVVAEAMASGLPVVAGHLGGYAEVVSPGETGFLVQSQEEAWEALDRLAHDPSLRASMGQAGMRAAQTLHGGEALQTLRTLYCGAAPSLTS